MHHEAWVPLAALLFDLLYSDPPNRWHPVAWMGTLIARLRHSTPAGSSNAAKFFYGGAITCGGGALVWLLTWGVTWLSHRLPLPLDWLVQAWLLKMAFSLRGLHHAVYEVETALRCGDLPAARRLLSWHLVSRDTTQLNTAHIAGAAIASAAENTSDSVVAPLLWYAIGGLPAALLYRYVNTADSLLGYRDAEREWLGKIPARADDVLNLLPARLTALLFIVLRPRAWSIWRRDARRTASPNAGQPMSAMAGALGVTLEKVGYYTLNAGARLPQADDIRRARRLLLAAAGLFICALLVFLKEHP